jgi:acrylyl-CoA reductase (NADPH)
MRAVLAAEPSSGLGGRLADISQDDLPEGDVTVRVRYSSLNYKDGLAVTGKGKVVRSFPMVCGVDLAGTVVESSAERVRVGDAVIVTGFGLGEERFGGFADLARVRSEWVVPMPAGLDHRRAMGIGTAGLTAMLCVMALEHGGLEPSVTGDLPVVVTGAAGGVGSVAVALLARLGHAVAAVSGRAEQEPYLRMLGAREIVPRSELQASPSRPLESERWAGGVDVVGGSMLATILRQTRYGGTVAATGLAGGSDLPTTVFPFIIRGLTLAGVESVRCPLERREVAWHRLAAELDQELLDEMIVDAELADVVRLAGEILDGRTRGRVVVAVDP